jgi:multiple sugar transport system substrate-binding protein/putative aldouronate transport system substrate-binding protein
MLANFSGVQIGWAADILAEKFGVRLTIINDMDGTFATRMAAGNLGDIVIFGGDGNQYLDAAAAGMLIDWEADNLVRTYGPYIYEHMQLAMEKNRNLTAVRDANGGIAVPGTVYGFGHNVAGSSQDHEAHIYYPYLRWDLYTQLGRPPINTLEDYIPILADMHRLEPLTSIGTRTYAVSSFPDWDGDMVMMVKATAALYGWEEFGMGLYNVIDQRFQGSLEPNGEYLRALRFYNQLHQLGLFDPDSMTQTFHEAAAKYRNGTSFWNIFTFVAESFNNPANLEAGKSLQCVPAADQMNLVEGLNIYGGVRVWTIGARSNHPELAMRIINWLCTPEGVMTYNYGPQGVTWDYCADGHPYLTEVGFLTRDDKSVLITYKGVTQSYEDGEFQHNNTTWNRDSVNPDSANLETFNWEHWDSTFLNRHVYPIEQSWRDWSGTVTADEYLRNLGKVAVSIGTPFSLGGRSDELDLIWEQVTTEIVSGSWSAIYARSDAEFDEIVARMIRNAHAYGYHRCIDWLEERAQARREEENKVLGR